MNEQAEPAGASGLQAKRPRRLPTWPFVTAGSVLLVLCLVATGFTTAHLEGSRADAGRAAYAVPALIGVLALAAFVGAYLVAPRGRNRWGRPLFLLLACFALGMIAAVLDAVNETRNGEPEFAPWLIAIIVGFGLWGSIEIWRNLDEAAREAHKWAWYWGASAGLALALPLFILGEQSARYRARLGLDDSFEQGVMTVLVLELVCYGLAWLFWWARRR